MKKKIGLFLSITLTLLFSFGGMKIVSAVGGGSNIGGSYGGQGSSGCTTTNCAGDVFYGARVSLVDRDGNRVTDKVVDFWPRAVFSSPTVTKYRIRNTMYLKEPGQTPQLDLVYFGNNIRQDVVRGNGFQMISGEDYWSLPHVKKMSDVVPDSFPKGANANVYNFSQAFTTAAFSDPSVILTLFSYLDYSGSLSDAILLDYFLQFEPIITTPRINNGSVWYFIGSYTEFMYTQDGQADWGRWWLDNNDYKSGVYINPTKKPNIFTSGSATTSSDRLRNIGGTNSQILGDAVGHIWLADLVENNCSGAETYLNSLNQWQRNAQFPHVKAGGNFQINGVNQSLNSTQRSYLHLGADGMAYCDTPPAPCGQPASVYNDSCSTGISYYRDDSSGWLSCKVAYRDNGVNYSSDNTGHLGPKDATGADTYVGNENYCRIYCYEDITSYFPTSTDPALVKSGQTFGWGINGGRDGVFGTVVVSKHCSVSQGGYKYSTWLSHYKTNEQSLVDAYLKVLAYQELQGQTTTSTATENHSCADGYTLNGTSCTKELDGTTGKSYCVDTLSGSYNYATRKCTVSVTPSSSWSGSASKQSAVEKTYSDSFVGLRTSGSISVTGSSSGQNSEQEAKTAAENDLNTKITNGINAGDGGFKAKESEYLTAIAQCVNNLEYQNGLTVDFSFDEPVNSSYGTPKKLNQGSYKLEANVISGSVRSTNSVGNCTSSNVSTYSVGTSVTTGSATTYNCQTSGITWDLNATIEYSYPAPEFTWFTLKTDGTLMNYQKKEEDPTAKDSYNNPLKTLDETYFYYIGYGIPTAITLTDGTYKRLKVEVSKIGDQDPEANKIKTMDDVNDDTRTPSGKTSHFEPITITTLSNGTPGFVYTCPYKVENDLFGYDCRHGGVNCDPTDDDDSGGDLKGVDVAYRVISLLGTSDDIKKSFPGQNGTGRRIGSNWQEGIDKIITDTERASGVTVDDKIHEILRSDVYTSSRAMYDIMLDVPTLTSIRQDTENFSSSHSGENPYTTFSNVTCKSLSNDPNSSGYNVTYCASDFITDLISSGKLQGNCAINLDSGRRAEHILASGCDASYTPITPTWNR